MRQNDVGKCDCTYVDIQISTHFSLFMHVQVAVLSSFLVNNSISWFGYTLDTQNVSSFLNRLAN